MRRLFGRGDKPKEEAPPPPTLQDAGTRLQARGDTIDARIKKIDGDLMELRKQILATRGSTQERLKQRAMQLLKQKKMYEQQQDQVLQQQFHVEQMAFTTETMAETKIQLDAMKQAAEVMKAEFKKFNVAEVEKMQDELRDLYEQHEEIQEIMGQTYDVDPTFVDEDDLNEQLNALAFDMEKQKDASYLDQALSMPQAGPLSAPKSTVPNAPMPAVAANPQPAVHQHETDPQALEAQLGL
jgi:charged multivesicular body protein 5